MENKTLKEKIMRSQVEAIGGELAVEDVKQFIKEILEDKTKSWPDFFLKLAKIK